MADTAPSDTTADHATARLDAVRQRRRLVVWRIVAVLAFGLAVFAALPKPKHVSVPGPHLVRLKIAGVIADDSDRIAAIDAAAKDAAVRGMVLELDSPGGTVGGGEALHDALARFAAAKPLVVVMDDVAASAAYMAAVPAARIFARDGTLTGSIGVMMQAPDFSGLLGKVGVSVDLLVSGPLKGQPSGSQPLSPAGRSMLQGIIDDYYGQFVDMVARGRNLPVERVRTLADGRPYTGRQALANGLIDQIGGDSDARDWLAAHRKVAADLRIVALPRPDRHPARALWRRLLAGDTSGDDAPDDDDASLGGALWHTLLPAPLAARADALMLSGPVAIWQP